MALNKRHWSIYRTQVGRARDFDRKRRDTVFSRNADCLVAVVVWALFSCAAPKRYVVLQPTSEPPSNDPSLAVGRVKWAHLSVEGRVFDSNENLIGTLRAGDGLELPEGTYKIRVVARCQPETEIAYQARNYSEQLYAPETIELEPYPDPKETMYLNTSIALGAFPDSLVHPRNEAQLSREVLPQNTVVEVLRKWPVVKGNEYSCGQMIVRIIDAGGAVVPGAIYVAWSEDLSLKQQPGPSPMEQVQMKRQFEEQQRREAALAVAEAQKLKERELADKLKKCKKCPDHIKEAVALPEGDGFQTYFSLVTSDGQYVPAAGKLSIVALMEFMNGGALSEPAEIQTRVLTINDFKKVTIGVGGFARPALVCAQYIRRDELYSKWLDESTLRALKADRSRTFLFEFRFVDEFGRVLRGQAEFEP